MWIPVKIIFLNLFLIVGFTGLSQQFGGGLTAGVVGSQVAGDTFSGYNKGGIFAGGFVTLGFGGRSAMQLELAYFQKGSRENPTEENFYQSFLLRLNYVEMALLYQYQMGRFIVEAGPSTGVLTSHYEEFNQDITSDYAGYSKPLRMTLQINLGMVFLVDPHWQVMLRTNNSMMSIRDKDYPGIFRFWDYGQYNDALVLGVRYVLRSSNR